MTILCFLDHCPVIPPRPTSTEPVVGDTNGICVTVPPDCQGHTISPRLERSQAGADAVPSPAASLSTYGKYRCFAFTPTTRELLSPCPSCGKCPHAGSCGAAGLCPASGAASGGAGGRGRSASRHVERIRGCGQSPSQLRYMLKSAASRSPRRPPSRVRDSSKAQSVGTGALLRPAWHGGHHGPVGH